MRLREYIDYIMHCYVLEYCNIKNKKGLDVFFGLQKNIVALIFFKHLQTKKKSKIVYYLSIQ